MLLILLAWYASASQNILTFSRCLADPEGCNGKEVPIFLEAHVLEITPDLIRISQPDGPLDVVIPPGFDGMVPAGTSLEDVKPGQSLEAVTVFRLPGYLELKAFRSARLRKMKIIISIFPVIVVGILLAVAVRWENGRLVIKEVVREVNNGVVE